VGRNNNEETRKTFIPTETMLRRRMDDNNDDNDILRIPRGNWTETIVNRIIRMIRETVVPCTVIHPGVGVDRGVGPLLLLLVDNIIIIIIIIITTGVTIGIVMMIIIDGMKKTILQGVHPVCMTIVVVHPLRTTPITTAEDRYLEKDKAMIPPPDHWHHSTTKDDPPIRPAAATTTTTKDSFSSMATRTTITTTTFPEMNDWGRSRMILVERILPNALPKRPVPGGMVAIRKVLIQPVPWSDRI
jgi:hypothetical protein